MTRHGYNVNDDDDDYTISRNKFVPVVAIVKQTNRKLRLF